MCSADNFKSHLKRTVSIGTDPDMIKDPLRKHKAYLGNDLDGMSGNAGKRDEWERQRQEQAKQQAGMGSYSNTYTDENGVRQTYASGEGRTELTRNRKRAQAQQNNNRKTVLGGGYV